MEKFLLTASTLLSIVLSSHSQSLLVMGDIHYDRLEDHDMEWLATRGDNLRQITQEYTVWTRDNWPAFSAHVSTVVKDPSRNIAGLIQLGDLSEGLAGSDEKALGMATGAIAAIDSLHLTVPVVLTKGNHDITGPGAKDAFNQVFLPAMARLSHRGKELKRATYLTEIGDDVAIVAYDPWDRHSTPEMLDSLLRSTKARHKFVSIHEPVIPVNYRCWHVYRKDDDMRQRLLRAIASNGAVVLCAHLHKFSVVKRDTEWGSIVQVQVNSVVRDNNFHAPATIETRYNREIVTSRPESEPATLDQRCEWIEAEMPHVRYYTYCDLPGYAIITINGDDIVLNYYGGTASEPFTTLNLSKI